MGHTEPWNILVGDNRVSLAAMPEASVHCCVTSPPYWGLRDYGCDGQIGLEQTPDEYVQSLVEVFREVARVLRPDGTLWLNLGDSYASGGVKGLKAKDLCGMPWRVAFALQADGWYLRSDIIWHKPNPMPESVRDRPTGAHEYLFLLAHPASKGRYYYDSDAVRERAATANSFNGSTRGGKSGAGGDRNDGGRGGVPGTGQRNRRDVWTITSKPYKGAHFAVMPPGLISPCIKAGTSSHGCCAQCGAPYARDVERTKVKVSDSKRSSGNGDRNDAEDGRYTHTRRTTGWTPGCEHDAGRMACSVLDPFAGASTTGVVAYKLGRRFVGCELNPEYATLGMDRMAKAAAQYSGVRFQILPV